MHDIFDDRTTTDQLLDGRNLRGTTVLVTGVSAGIGIETARALAAHGAAVIGTARDLDKAAQATARVRAAAAAGGGGFDLVALDLADLASVRACTDGPIARGARFDIVIANAGVMATPLGYTVDGFETQFGTNHLGHFLLVNRLLPIVADGGRVVILSSAGHRFSDVDLDDPGFQRTAYEPFAAYGRSKTANILFAVELDARTRHRGVRVAAVHPGGVRTELSRHLDAEAGARMIETIDARNAAAGLPPFRYKTIPEGAATSIWAATIAAPEDIGGRYCEDCHVAPVIADPALRGGVRPYAIDRARARALWSLSEQMVGESF